MNRLVIVTIISLFSCNTELLFDGFDSAKWKEDALGCNMVRVNLTDEIISRKAELFGLSENEISSIFGKPNRHELYSRNKKAYVYFIEGGPDCKEPLENPNKLVIRFNGVGLSKEVVLYKN